MDADNTEEREEEVGAGVSGSLSAAEVEWLAAIQNLANLYQKRAETFVRYKSARPVRVSGKLIPVTDAMAEAQTYVETGRDIMLQEALVTLAARRMDRDPE